MDEILEITPIPLPFGLNEKIFIPTDDQGNSIGEPYSYNDWIQKINDISEINCELLGNNIRHENP